MKKKMYQRCLAILMSAAVTATGFPVNGIAAKAAAVEEGFSVEETTSKPTDSSQEQEMEGEPVVADSEEDFIYYEYTENEESYIEISGFTDANTVKAVLPGTIDGKPVRRIAALSNSSSHLEEIVIPPEVKSISAGCFWQVDTLKTVTFSGDSGLESIGAQAFGGSGLEEIVIPAGVTSMGNRCFESSEYLRSVVFQENSSLAAMAYGAFENCTALEEIEIPASVTELGNYCFHGCSGLERVGVEEGSRLERIGDNCFLDAGLTGFTVPASVRVIGREAFQAGKKLTELIFEEGSALETLGEGAFSFTGLTSVRIPESVKSIGNNCFYSTNLTSAKFATNGVLETLGKDAFGFTKLTSVQIPESVKSIGEGCFGNAMNLTSVEFAEHGSLEEIGRDAFRGSAIEEILLPGSLKNIGGFSGCEKLSSVSFAEGSQPLTISGYAFQGTAFTEFTVPDSVTAIEEYAFSGCRSLKTINFPDGGQLERIGERAFERTGVTQMALPDTLESLPEGMLQYATSLEEIRLPASLTRIGEDCFYGCTSLKSIELPASTTEIGARAFWNCAGLWEIELPANVTAVGFRSFADCSNLTTISFAENTTLTDLGAGAFSRTAVEQIVLPETLECLPNELFHSCQALQKVELPEGITQIGEGCFTNCSSLHKIRLPESVVELGSSSFANCEELQTVEFGAEPKLSAIGYGAFENTGIIDITLPETLERLPESLFRSSSELQKVSLPESIAQIGQECFANCGSLQEIQLPDGVVEIGPRCFSNCKNLQTVQIGAESALSAIGDYAFAYTGIIEIVLPETLESLAYGLFECCAALQRIELPQSVTQIGDYCFNRSNLQEIQLPDRLTSIGNYAFWDTAVEKLEITSMEEMTIGDQFMPFDSVVYCYPNASIIERLDELTFSDPSTGVERHYQYVIMGKNRRSVNVTDENGQPLSAGLQAVWYKSGSKEPVGRGLEISVLDDTVAYDCEILLEEELGLRYYEPKRITVEAGEEEASLTLEPIGAIPVSGKITDKQGNPLAGAAVGITTTANGKYKKTVSAVSGEDGSFLAEIDNTQAEASISLEGYRTRQIALLSERTDQKKLECQTAVLYPLPSSRIRLSIKYRSAVKQGTEAEESEVASADGYSVLVRNSATGQLIDSTLEYPWVLLEESSVKPQDTVTVQVSYQDDSRTAQSAQAVLDESCAGDCSVVFSQKGYAVGERFTGAMPIRAFVFDSTGKRLSNQTAADKWESGSLPEGTYRAVFMQDQGYIQDIPSMEMLDKLGMKEQQSYALVPFEIRDGVITEISSVDVPEWKPDRWNYLNAGGTSVSVSRSTVTPGGYVSLRMRYSVCEEEADRMKEKKLVLQLPETMRYVEGSMIQAQNQSMAASVAYDADAGTLEIPLSQFGAELENTGYLRCMLMSMAAGNDTITPYLSFELEQDGPLQLAQSLGSVEIQSPKLNLKTAEKTGTAEITVQGNALPGKTVRIYDNGT